jgi:5-methylcytosine-specific restriction endonuclease McrA
MSKRAISSTLRRSVAESARYRCGYCLTSQRIVGPLLEIDHIVPEAAGGSSDETNLTLACPLCNSHKADRTEAIDPETQAVVALFNPRNERWSDHFKWIEGGTTIQGRSAQGRATIGALAMNHPDMIVCRRLWVLAGWHPPTE